MKLKNFLMTVIMVIGLLYGSKVYAVESKIIFEGEDSIVSGGKGNISIKISSGIEVGVVSGKIEKSSNIDKINVQGINGWSLTYNKETGVFNILKAEGSKDEQILNIEYTVNQTTGKGNITLNNIKFTTIDYKEINLNSIKKEITIKSSGDNPPTVTPEMPEAPVTQAPTPIASPEQNPNQENLILSKLEITKEPTKTSYTEGQKFDNKGMIVKAVYSNGSSREISNYKYSPDKELKTSDTYMLISYTEGNITKEIKQKITVKSTSITNPLPQTGISYGIIFIAIGVVVISIISYIGYKKYKI